MSEIAEPLRIDCVKRRRIIVCWTRQRRQINAQTNAMAANTRLVAGLQISCIKFNAQPDGRMRQNVIGAGRPKDIGWLEGGRGASAS